LDQRLAALVRGSSRFAGIADLDGRALFLNEAGQRLVGLNGGDGVERTALLDYFAPEDRAFVRDEVLPTVLSEGRWSAQRVEALDVPLRHFGTGEPIPVAWECVRIDDPVSGEPLGFGVVVLDGTERQRAEQVRGAAQTSIRTRVRSARRVVPVCDDSRAFDPASAVAGRAPAEGREPSADEVRVLLVEDHAAVREAIASAFERDAGFEIAGQAASLREARGMLRNIDVAVLDLGLPDGYGADLIDELHRASPGAQALVLSASFDRAEIARAVERGAAGVLHKSAGFDEVVDSVRRLRAGETLLPSEEVADLLRFAARQRRREHADRQAIAQLTGREREVLQALAEGLDIKGVAERLDISVRTVRNHTSNILAKLGVHSQLQALVLALRYDVVALR
jgi:PAS domain S-box-containing protein